MTAMAPPNYQGYPVQGYLPPPPPPPQYPAASSYPGAPGQLPAGYPQQYAQPQYQQPAYPPQGYNPAQQFTPAAPLAQGSIDDFYSQPSVGGGKALKFEQIGQTYIFIVPRPITQADIQQQTDTTQRPQFFKDGRPKFVMRVPAQMQPSAEFPDGIATWFVKGAARDELSRAMAEVGAPQGPPEAGSIIQVSFTGQRASGAGMNPAKLFAVTYRRPEGAQPVAAQPAAQAPVQQPVYAPQLDPMAAQMAQAVGQVQQAFPQAAEVPAAAPQFQPPTAAQYVPAPQPPQAPAQALTPPAGLSPEQVALLATLTNA